MVETNIGSADESNLTSAIKDFSVDSMQTEAEGSNKESYFYFTKWAQYYGYYKQVPELKAAVDAIAKWTIGKGFTSDAMTTAILENISGYGEDTFNTILKNMIIVRQIAGDAFAEVMRDKNGRVINIKPLDTGAMAIVADEKGLIKRYEQITKIKGNKNKKFEPEDILHLVKNRVGDSITGTSIIEAVEDVILMRNEAVTDYKRVLHRNVEPLMIFHLDTDDPERIAAFKSKIDTAKGTGENMYVPKDAVVPEQISLSGNATMNPLSWIEYLSSFFFQAVGIPQIILGGSQEFTEATAKIAYLAFQQSVEDEQRDIEAQLWAQLQLDIKLEFPASLENELLSDSKKDSTGGAAQPNETTAGAGQ